MRSKAARSGRWFSGYLVLLGLVSAAWITLVETLFSDGPPRLMIGAVWVVVWIAASLWAERQSVYPAGASRHLWIAFASWFGLFLLIIGPLVRGQFGDELLPWVAGSLLMSVPFFIAAASILRRR